MSHHGYSRVEDMAFIGFQNKLSEGAWAQVSSVVLVDRSAGADPNAMITALMQAPTLVTVKALMLHSVGQLVQALDSKASSVEAVDAAWDSAQRRFSYALAEKGESLVPQEREAAHRLRQHLLLGRGTAQTTLPPQKEVDFGHTQFLTAQEPQNKADLQLLGLEGRVAELQDLTLQLERAVQEQQQGAHALSRAQRRSFAKAQCVEAFNLAHTTLQEYLNLKPTGLLKEQLEQLLAPLQALLSAHPAAKAEPTAPA
jgi:hypothetical protein